MAERLPGNCHCCDCDRFSDSFTRPEETLCEDGVNLKDAFGDCRTTYSFTEGDWEVESNQLLCNTTDSPITFAEYLGPQILNIGAKVIYPSPRTGHFHKYHWGDNWLKCEWLDEDTVKVSAHTNTEDKEVEETFLSPEAAFLEFRGVFIRRLHDHELWSHYCESADADLLGVNIGTENWIRLFAKIITDSATGFVPYQLSASAGVRFDNLHLFSPEPNCQAPPRKGCCELCLPDQEEGGGSKLPTTIAVTFSGLQDGEIWCGDAESEDICRDDRLEEYEICEDYYGGFGLYFPCLDSCGGIFAPGCFDYCIEQMNQAICEICTAEYHAGIKDCYEANFECTPRFAPASEFNTTYILDLTECMSWDGGSLPCKYEGVADVEDIWLSEAGCVYDGTASIPIEAELWLRGQTASSEDVEIYVFPPFNVVLRNDLGDIQFISSQQPMNYQPRLTTGILTCDEICGGGSYDLLEDVGPDDEYGAPEDGKLYADWIVFPFGDDPIRWTGADYTVTFYSGGCEWSGQCLCEPEELHCDPADHTEITPFLLEI